MSLKDDLKVVKEELSKDEKLLEQAFQIEKFLKKHKKKIYATIIAATIALIGYWGYSYYTQVRLNKANEALLTLYKNPNDKEALETLKSNNPKLYNLYLYNQAANKGSKEELNRISNPDSLLEDLITYHKSVIDKAPKESNYYKNLVLVEKAYLLLKEGKKEEAKSTLSLVDKTSPVSAVARILMHYTIQ